MTLHEHRRYSEAVLAPFVRWCSRRDVDPNKLTWFAALLSLVTGLVLFLSSPATPWLLVVATFLLIASAMMDLADGLLARATDRATDLGDFLDHVLDRYADVFILLGLTFSPWVRVEVGLFAIIGTLLTSYMGTQAQAVGVGRDYGGLLGRADRLFLLLTAPVVQAALVWGAVELPYGTSALELALGWIALAGNVTALQRFWGSYRALR